MPAKQAAATPTVRKKTSRRQIKKNSRRISDKTAVKSIDLAVTRQLALFLDNRPGTLARVCEVLADAGISIYAISTSDTVDHSVVRLVVSDPFRALRIMERYDVLVVENEVLMLDGLNRPGSLAGIAKALAHAGVNIEYAYCATDPNSDRGLMIIRPSDITKAMQVLNCAF